MTPGYRTTEFWLTIAANVLAAVLAYLQTIDATWAIVSVSILNGLYALVRSGVKGAAIRQAGRTLSLLLLAGLLFISTGCGALQVAEPGVRDPFTGVLLRPRADGGGAKAVIDQLTVDRTSRMVLDLLSARNLGDGTALVPLVPIHDGK